MSTWQSLPWLLGLSQGLDWVSIVPSEEKSQGVERTVEKPKVPVLKIELIANLTTIKLLSLNHKLCLNNFVSQLLSPATGT
jgi:hypothetical protein